MLHVYAAVAEEEARAISKRTKAALAAASAGGIKLGGYRGGPVPSAHTATAARVAKADAFAARVLPLVREMRADGLSQSAIARELTARGVLTARGGREWTPTAVRNVLAREVDHG